jgi:von Willebrand factor type A domain
MNLDDLIKGKMQAIAQNWEIDQEEEEKRQRIERFSQFFNRVNSAFSFRHVTVKVENSSMSAPAWSTSNVVTFNSNQLGDLKDAKQIAGIKGLNLHELCHILYTPREGSELVDQVIEEKLWSAFNALEDQRIETLFTTKYPSTIDWFTATILIHFVENPKAFNTSYPLLRGRKYLSVDLRAQSRALYPEPQNIDEISQIVDEYRLLIFPADTEKGIDLIRRFNALLPKGDGSGNGNGGEGGTATLKPAGEGEEGDVNVVINDPFGHGQRPTEGIESNPNSRPVSPKQQKGDRDRASKQNPQDDAEKAEEIKNSKPTIELNADQIDWDLSDDAGDLSGDADDAGNEPSDDLQSGDQAGAGVAEMIATALDEILSNHDNQKELNEIIRQIGGLPSLATNDAKEPELTRYNALPVDALTFQASRSFAKELERLKASFDPAWDRYESSGRFNVQRMLREDDRNTLFDQWNAGIEDACEIECVIALDNSGSMQGNKASKAYRSMYAIKRALDKIGASTTVITFNSETNVLYRASDKATNVIRDAGAGGGTEATDAVRYGTKILAESDKPVKIFFAITDGEWGGDLNIVHDQIERMARAGVLTALAYIPFGDERVVLDRDSAHRCEIGAVVHNPMDLINMAKLIVKYAITRRLVNR